MIFSLRDLKMLCILLDKTRNSLHVLSRSTSKTSHRDVFSAQDDAGGSAHKLKRAKLGFMGMLARARLVRFWPRFFKSERGLGQSPIHGISLLLAFLFVPRTSKEKSGQRVTKQARTECNKLGFGGELKVHLYRTTLPSPTAPPSLTREGLLRPSFYQ